MSTARRTTSTRRHIGLTLGRVLVLSSMVSVVVLTQAGAAEAGTSSFARWILTHTGNVPTSVAVADFNGDGEPDVVTGGNDVVVMLGTGDGRFDSGTDYETSGYYTDSVGAGDFDADGNTDLVASSSDGNEVWVWLGSPDGTFEDSTTFGAGENPSSVTVDDLNHDGDLDLAVANRHAGTVSVLLGGAGGTFGSAAAFPAGEFPLSLVASDVDGDSDLDLAVSNGGTLAVLLGNGDGSFGPPTSQDVGGLADSFSAITAGDFNGDADPDLAVLGEQVGIVILLGGGDGTFAATHTVAPVAGYDTSRVMDIAVGDFNDDSHPDLGLAAPGSGFAVVHGDGDGTFSDFKTFSTNGSPVAVAVADFNADHHPDVVVANQFSADSSFGDVSVLLNTLDSTPPDTTITSGPGALTNDATPTFTFTSSEPGSTFECRLEDADFSPCTSPLTLPAQDDRAHGFYVRAIDASGNVDETPAVRIFQVDTIPPDTFVLDGPEGLTTDATPTFAFRASELEFTSECRLDDAPFSPCTSPLTLPALDDGTHTFEMRVKDDAGNVDPSPAVRTFTVDTVAPQTTITGGPEGPTNDNTPTFTFVSSEPGSTFECGINGAFGDCTSPWTSDGIGDGEYTFQVRAKDAAGNEDASPASRAFTLDRNPPTTSITSGPSGWTGDSTPTFGFTSPEPGATFECRVDDAAFEACTTPHTTAELADGDHVFQARAVDTTGNVDPIPAAIAFTVDTVAPDTVISSGPSGLIYDRTPSVSFSDIDGAKSHECRVDDEPFEPCTSPTTTAPLSDGAHTFDVRAIDWGGNVDPTPARLTFTIDTEIFRTGITGGPSGLTNDATPTFTFGTPDPNSTFECRIAPAPFADCTSPYTASELSDGDHTFEVRATDSYGNVEPTPAKRAFTVDSVAPDTAVDSGPTGTIDDQTPTFGFSSPDAGATFECRVDGADFGPCASPFTTAVLANGSHTFQVRAKDAAGNADATPAGRTFTVKVDTTAPKTRIDSGPADVTNQTRATFTFSADEPATFECKLDAGAYAACESGDSFGPLGSGTHTFAVRATDEAGNVDPVPASKTWIVDTTPPQTTITSGPSGLSLLSSKATFGLASSEGGSSFQCRLDSGAWQSCTSPWSVTQVHLGNHTVSVRATDPAGNVDPTPATRTWLTLGLLPL
ncbi:FG-GAP-like repeat-containing protein [Aeromicrobium terrae]|uniref:VCBS repeat-containing protein n=1 Tax=Aeromicrobium terrae TaxID=2498846 RepID=A0A5C8NHQ5_9ACTN|nr:FG-GAP-like repeat-containing protein [Aeromicrobium terrae]TXL61414.1 VCBS repeat-containing protein [Aeromicrobium terrae]